jgi:hypothetical protein
MTSRRLLILGALALVAIVAAFLLANHRSGTSGSALSTAFYPDLKLQADAVDAVRIYKAGDARAVELIRADSNNWTVTERNAYAADATKIRKLLLALAQAKPVEQKTSNPDQYVKLGVEDVAQPAASGVRIELHGQKTPVNVIVGKPGNGPQAMYVRRAGEPASWLINEVIDTSSSPDAWLRKEIIDVPADRMQSAAIAIGGEKAYNVTKQSRADADFKVDAVPKGKELNSPAAANGVASALTALTLADVIPAKDLAAEKPAAHTTLKTFDGLVVDADGWIKDGKHYVALKTAFDESLAKQFHVEPAPVAEKSADKPADKADAAKADVMKAAQTPASPAAIPAPAPAPDVAADSSTVNTKLAGWAYEVPEYKYDAIFKPIEQLLKKDEPKGSLLKKK